jgi:hypothetical protein
MMFEGLNGDRTDGAIALLTPGQTDTRTAQPWERPWGPARSDDSRSDHAVLAYDDDLDEDESYFLETDEEEDDEYEDDDSDELGDDDAEDVDTEAEADDDDDL